MTKLKNIFNPYFFWFGGLLLLLGLIHSQYFFDGDEGVVLSGAWRLFNKQKLYTDFFEMTAPLAYYLLYWLWRIFTVNYLSAKILGILTLFGSAIGIYKISRLTTKSDFALLVPYLFVFTTPLWSLINYHNFSLFFIVWAIYFFQKGLIKINTKNFIISGLFTGITILTVQHKGFALLAAGSIYLFLLFWQQKQTIWLKKIPPYLGAAFMALIWPLLSWPSKILYENLIAWPFLNYSAVAKVELNVFYLFLVLLLASFIVLKKYWSKELLWLYFAYLFLLLTTIPAANYFHIIAISFPLLAVLPLLIKKISTFKSFRTALYLELALIVLLIMLQPLSLLFYLHPFYSVAKKSQLLKYIANNCGDSPYIYAGPFAPEIYFATRKKNPTHYDWLITNHNTEKQFSLAAASLMKNPPTCAVTNYQRVKKYRYNPGNPVDIFIQQNYLPVFMEKNYTVWQKQPAK